MKVTQLLRRPLGLVKNSVGFSKSDPPWLKWVKRLTTVIVAVASALAGLGVLLLAQCI